MPIRQNRKERLTAAVIGSLKNLRPLFRQYCDCDLIMQRQEAKKRSLLAILTILELIVSGSIPQATGEDYTTTACRLVQHGLCKVKVSGSTRRKFNKALAALKESWTVNLIDIVKMRGWRGKRATTRALLLMALMEKTIGSAAMRKWLRNPNPNLAGKAPLDLARTGKWLVLADFVDDMLTGSPT